MELLLDGRLKIIQMESNILLSAVFISRQLYLIGADTWVFGGPLSAQVLVKKVVTALTKK